jgi:hypothetical protein
VDFGTKVRELFQWNTLSIHINGAMNHRNKNLQCEPLEQNSFTQNMRSVSMEQFFFMRCVPMEHNSFGKYEKCSNGTKFPDI